MPRVYLIGYAPEELTGLASRLRQDDFEAEILTGRGADMLRVIRTNAPDAFVIDLMRMPSFGRSVATFLRQRKDTRPIPLVFIEGDPEKMDVVRQLLPDAVYAKSTKLGDAVRKALRQKPTDPIRADPTRIDMQHKLRVRENSTVALLHAPADFTTSLGPLPKGARVQTKSAGAEIILAFEKTAAALSRDLPVLKPEVVPGRTVWIVWPKKTSGIESDLSPTRIFEICASFDLACHRICALDGTWSALAVAARRRASRARR